MLARDSLMDILARFIHLQVEEKKVGEKKVRKETMIFPRYHQLDCVRQLVADARAEEPARTTWSSIRPAAARATPSPGWRTGWPACTTTGTSRSSIPSSSSPTAVVLDQQLQNTIYQFEHKQGVVQKIDENSASLPRR